MIPSVTTISDGVCNMSHSTMHKIMLLVTVKEWYHTKRPILSDLLCVPIWGLICLIYTPELIGSYKQEHLVAKQQKLSEK
jgi:hypothetical protein